MKLYHVHTEELIPGQHWVIVAPDEAAARAAAVETGELLERWHPLIRVEELEDVGRLTTTGVLLSIEGSG